MDIEHELRRHLILVTLIDLFVGPVTFLPGMFFMTFSHIKLTNLLSTGPILLIIGVVALAMGIWTYYQIKL